jgi:hypothetical protein
MLRSKMILANAILSLVDYRMPDAMRDQVWVEAYANGREQGYHLATTSSRCVSFSEGRNHDGIVIYRGTTLDFSMQGNTPNDRAYRDKIAFDRNKVAHAADAIIEYLSAPNEA